jgi:GAF domain-containing protein
VARLSARLAPLPLLQLICDTLASDFQAALARIWIESSPPRSAPSLAPTLAPTRPRAQPARTLLLRASAGLSRRTTQSPRARIDLRRYRFKVGVVARSGQPFLSNDIAGDGDFDQRWVQKERLASVAVLPLIADEVAYGVLAAFFRVALNEEVTGALRMFSAVAAGCLAAHPIASDGKRASP